jgi:hypothetical protein
LVLRSAIVINSRVLSVKVILEVQKVSKKESNQGPSKGMVRPAPPPPPPCRTFREGFFSGFSETRESIRKREDYEVFMIGYSAGLKNSRK